MTIINETSYRVRSHKETLVILEQYKNLAGITRLADITNLDYTGLPVFTAIRPRAKSLSTSQGKGITKNAAKCSALMEAIEVYFAENLSPEVLNKSIYDLSKTNLSYINPNNLNNRVTYTNDIESINWVKVSSMKYGNSILAPFPEFSLNSFLKEVLIYSPNTTGLSGGNTYEEALLHSLLEIIERESTDSHLEVKDIKNDLLNKINQFFECKIFYKQNSYEIPSFEALIKSKSPFDNQIIFKGSGCHLDKKIAINRALIEAIQSRVTIIAGSRDDIVDSKYEDLDFGWDLNVDHCSFNAIPNYSCNDIQNGINFIFEKTLKSDKDIIVFKYHDEDICILKSKIIATDFINNV